MNKETFRKTDLVKKKSIFNVFMNKIIPTCVGIMTMFNVCLLIYKYVALPWYEQILFFFIIVVSVISISFCYTCLNGKDD